MKTFFSVALFLMMLQQPTPNPTPGTFAFHNCHEDGGTGNDPHYQDMSEFYKCDEGLIELKGRWSMTIEHGVVYRTGNGKNISRNPHRN